jgi:acetyl esterase/lipase
MTQVEKNVVYGMHSGLALLMDVYYPDVPNGLGIIVANGSAWHAQPGYDSVQLKEGPGSDNAGRLADAGFTVFSFNHRAAPAFRYPAAVEDGQRVVRFVRYNASRYRIRPDSIGAFGSSSGAHIVAMLGLLGGASDQDDPDLVNRESAGIQCVVGRATPSDLRTILTPLAAGISSFIGMPFQAGPRPTTESSLSYKLYREASPRFNVTKDAPPFLLIHGDADSTVPYEQSEILRDGLVAAGIQVELVRIRGGEHRPGSGASDPVDLFSRVTSWFERHLSHGA